MATEPFSVGTLDPVDWPSARAQGHRMLDDILDYIETIRERPVWQPIPDADARAFPRRRADRTERSCRRA